MPHSYSTDMNSSRLNISPRYEYRLYEFNFKRLDTIIYLIHRYTVETRYNEHANNEFVITYAFSGSLEHSQHGVFIVCGFNTDQIDSNGILLWFTKSCLCWNFLHSEV